jgi:hypothetical protein
MTAQEYIEKEREEILGPDNRHFTWENNDHDHEPTQDEMAWNYIEHGGIDDFRKRHAHLVDDNSG